MNDPESLAIPAMSPRHHRRLLSDAALPSPNWWLRLGRVLPPILALQRDPALSVDAAARSFGFARGVEFADCARRTLGVTPKEARTVLSWEGVVGKGLTGSRRADPDAVAGVDGA
jgi:AraC-like DNA-binding protein